MVRAARNRKPVSYKADDSEQENSDSNEGGVAAHEAARPRRQASKAAAVGVDDVDDDSDAADPSEEEFEEVPAPKPRRGRKPKKPITDASNSNGSEKGTVFSQFGFKPVEGDKFEAIDRDFAEMPVSIPNARASKKTKAAAAKSKRRHSGNSSGSSSNEEEHEERRGSRSAPATVGARRSTRAAAVTTASKYVERNDDSSSDGEHMHDDRTGSAAGAAARSKRRTAVQQDPASEAEAEWTEEPMDLAASDVDDDVAEDPEEEEEVKPRRRGRPPGRAAAAKAQSGKGKVKSKAVAGAATAVAVSRPARKSARGGAVSYVEVILSDDDVGDSSERAASAQQLSTKGKNRSSDASSAAAAADSDEFDATEVLSEDDEEEGESPSISAEEDDDSEEAEPAAPRRRGRKPAVAAKQKQRGAAAAKKAPPAKAKRQQSTKAGKKAAAPAAAASGRAKRGRSRAAAVVESEESAAEESESEDEEGAGREQAEEAPLVIGKLLGSKTQTLSAWAAEMGSINTTEITAGSRWTQDDEDEDVLPAAEANSAASAAAVAADTPSKSGRKERTVERILVKWQDLSYLHVSWETEKDLLENIGTSAKRALRRLRDLDARLQLEEDRGDGDYFDPFCTQIERIIDIDTSSSSDRKFGIKWAALPYSETTYEDESDLIARGVDYLDAVAAYEDREALADRRAKAPPASSSSSSSSALATSFSALTFANGGSLRSYQEEGVKWMLVNWAKHRSSILADEMGLGKTLQTAAFLWHLHKDRNMPGPFLVVAPLSTIAHWQREIEGWTGMNTVIFHGSQDDRAIILEYELRFAADRRKAEAAAAKAGPKKGGFAAAPTATSNAACKPVVIVTTPEMVTRDDVQKVFSPLRFEVLVVDEAHKLKNDTSRLTSCLSQGPGNKIRWRKCLLLTGTPLQNNTEELWTLLNFVDPKMFESKANFSAQFGDMSDSGQVQSLVKLMKNYVLRRMKEDVEKDVPPKQETVVEVELTSMQKQYYRALIEQNTTFLLRGSGKRPPKDRPSLMNLAMELRKCCNHPYLINGAELNITEASMPEDAATVAKALAATGKSERAGAAAGATAAAGGSSSNGGSKASFSETPTEIDCMVACSGKLVLLDKLLPRLKRDGHRVLIFSQFKMMLDVIEDYLTGRRFSYGRIDGCVMGPERQRQIDRFQAADSEIFVMLLSTRAGGVGITLTAADTVIIYDSDWNPQNDLQAQARCHRIGQTKSVKVYRLLTRKTYEQVMFQAASKKLGLDQAVLCQGRAANSSIAANAVGLSDSSLVKGPTNAEVEQLLRKGAYDAFRDDDEASKRFCEADIDSILGRSQVIVHDAKKSAPGAPSNSFSKASFVADGVAEGEEVDVDDPEFWTKVVGLTMPEVREERLGKRAATKGKKTYIESRVGGRGVNSSDSSHSEGSNSDDSGGDDDSDSSADSRWTVPELNELLTAITAFGLERSERLAFELSGMKSTASVKAAADGVIAQLALRVSKTVFEDACTKKLRSMSEAYYRQQAELRELGPGAAAALVADGVRKLLPRPPSTLPAEDAKVLQNEAWDKVLRNCSVRSVADKGLPAVAAERLQNAHAAHAAAVAAGDAAAEGAALAAAGFAQCLTAPDASPDLRTLVEALRTVPAPPKACEPAFLDAHKKGTAKLSQLEDVTYSLKALAMADETVAELQREARLYPPGAPRPPRDFTHGLRWPDLTLPQSSSAADGWTADHDHALLRGVHKYGWPTKRTLVRIMEDKELGFPPPAPVAPPAAPAAAPAATDDAAAQDGSAAASATAAAPASGTVVIPELRNVLKRLRAINSAVKRAETTHANNLRAHNTLLAANALAAVTASSSSTSSTAAAAASSKESKPAVFAQPRKTSASAGNSTVRGLREALCSFGVPVQLLRSASPSLVHKNASAASIADGLRSALQGNNSSSAGEEAVAAETAAGEDLVRLVASAGLWRALAFSWSDLADRARWPDNASFVHDVQLLLATTIRDTGRPDSTFNLSVSVPHVAEQPVGATASALALTHRREADKFLREVIRVTAARALLLECHTPQEVTALASRLAQDAPPMTAHECSAWWTHLSDAQLLVGAARHGAAAADMERALSDTAMYEALMPGRAPVALAHHTEAPITCEEARRRVLSLHKALPLLNGVPAVAAAHTHAIAAAAAAAAAGGMGHANGHAHNGHFAQLPRPVAMAPAAAAAAAAPGSAGSLKRPSPSSAHGVSPLKQARLCFPPLTISSESSGSRSPPISAAAAAAIAAASELPWALNKAKRPAAVIPGTLSPNKRGRTDAAEYSSAVSVDAVKAETAAAAVRGSADSSSGAAPSSAADDSTTAPAEGNSSALQRQPSPTVLSAAAAEAAGPVDLTESDDEDHVNDAAAAAAAEAAALLAILAANGAAEPSSSSAAGLPELAEATLPSLAAAAAAVRPAAGGLSNSNKIGAKAGSKAKAVVKTADIATFFTKA